MKDMCDKNNIKYLVLLIPTKESVLESYIHKNQDLDNYELLNKLTNYENIVRDKLISSLKEKNIEYINLKKPLQNQISKKFSYPENYDGHPNMHGYQVIAKEIFEKLKN
jgi:hypothetical protein